MALKKSLKMRRALLSVSDKRGVVELAQAFSTNGVELVATGKTAKVLQEAGLKVVPIEEVSGSPEAFQGRMKTLSFPVCGGILYRRDDSQDLDDLKKLGISPIDCVVVNFYPFEEQAAKTPDELTELIDIGGPTLVRAAAKNSPDVLVLSSPDQYSAVIRELGATGKVEIETVQSCARTAWERVLNYDAAIARVMGARGCRSLRYGENPHQKGLLEFDLDGSIAWGESLTSTELSYNNILDLSAGYGLASDLVAMDPNSTGVVIVKHNNPCGVTLVPKSCSGAQKIALTRAWEGDPISAFGSVLVFTDPIEQEAADWLSQHFVELVAAPVLTQESFTYGPLRGLHSKRKNIKAVRIRRFNEVPAESMVVVPGGRLFQTADLGIDEKDEKLKSVTRVKWPKEKDALGRFGIAVCRALKSNAIAVVREVHSVPGSFQLIGAGQGQPNRVDALKSLAVPRAQSVLRASEGELGECIMVSDAFFPFRDTVDAAHAAGIRWIIQPGGSQKDAESIAACDEHSIAMAFTGMRHFRH